MKTLISVILFALCLISSKTSVLGQTCVWPRCNHPAISRTPQLCREHMQYRTKPEGEELRRLIEADDIEGVKRLAPVAGPDYFINGNPPLVHAIRSGHLDAVRALVDAGAYIRWRTATGENLVFFSARENRPEMARYFISLGVGTPDDSRRAGADVAQEQMATEVVRGFAKREMGFDPIDAFKMLEGAINANAARSNQTENRRSEPLQREKPSAWVGSTTPDNDVRPGEKYSQTRRRLLTRDELEPLNSAQLRYAINEMYARYGLYFRDSALRNQFRQFEWYKPDSELSMDQIEEHVTDVEKRNLELLGEVRNGR